MGNTAAPKLARSADESFGIAINPGADAKTMMKLYDVLDDNDDVQKVWATFDIDESEMDLMTR